LSSGNGDLFDSSSREDAELHQITRISFVIDAKMQQNRTGMSLSRAVAAWPPGNIKLYVKRVVSTIGPPQMWQICFATRMRASSEHAQEVHAS